MPRKTYAPETLRSFAEWAEYYLWLWLSANDAPRAVIDLQQDAAVLRQNAHWDLAGTELAGEDFGMEHEALADALAILGQMGATWPTPGCRWDNDSPDLKGWGMAPADDPLMRLIKAWPAASPERRAAVVEIVANATRELAEGVPDADDPEAFDPADRMVLTPAGLAALGRK